MATAPVTLDFSKMQPIPQAAPVTLDFSKAVPIPGVDQPTPTPQTNDWLARRLGQTDQTDLEQALAPTPHSADQGIVGNAKTALSNIGAAGLNALTHPEQLVTSAVQQSPPVQAFNDARDFVKHLQGQPTATSEAAAHPLQTAAQNAEQMIGTAGALGGPELAGEGVAALKGMTPKAQMGAAGQLFKSVAQDANKIPVDIDSASDGALKLMNWQRKTQLGPTINKFLNQITKGDLTYEDARDYYELFGKMSVDESLKMAAPVKRDFMNMVSGLKQDIGAAADKVGRLADYNQAMGDYATAAKHQQWYETAKDWVTKASLGAAGLGGVKTLWDKFHQ